MEDLKDRSVHLTAQKITREFPKMPIYKSFYSRVERVACRREVEPGVNFRRSLAMALNEAGLETELRNTVFHWVRSHYNNDAQAMQNKEPLAYLRKAQTNWEKRIHKSLNSMSAELAVPLARPRLQADAQEIADKWNELSNYDIDLSPYRPVYAPKDFLDVLLWIRSPNYRGIDGEASWDFTRLPLKIRFLTELRQVLFELSHGEPLLGVADSMPAIHQGHSSLEAERTLLAEKVLECKHSPVAQEFLKKGCPKAVRGRIWAQVLGCEVTDEHREYFKQLKDYVLKYELMIDKLIIKDVQLTASNDDQYFVFEDVLYQVLLCFSRDVEVLSVFNHACATPVHAILRNKSQQIENAVLYPPSGVIPFHGFTMYATPFCYLYSDPVALYLILRAFYVRYWFRLHEVSSHPQGILALCLQFERLLQRHEPKLWLHFKMINVQPIRVAFKWLMRGFSGHLPPAQLLSLWDQILGYDTLELLPLLAIAILGLRRENLMRVETLAALEAILADLSSINVMALLQVALFKSY